MKNREYDPAADHVSWVEKNETAAPASAQQPFLQAVKLGDFANAVYWTVPQAVRWLVGRQDKDVGNPHEPLPQLAAAKFYPSKEGNMRLVAASALLKALQAGALRAEDPTRDHAEIHANSWGVLEDLERLYFAVVPSDKVRSLPAKDVAEEREAQFEIWFRAEVASGLRKHSKAVWLAEAQRDFRGLSKAAFRRVWNEYAAADMKQKGAKQRR